MTEPDNRQAVKMDNGRGATYYYDMSADTLDDQCVLYFNHDFRSCLVTWRGNPLVTVFYGIPETHQHLVLTAGDPVAMLGQLRTGQSVFYREDIKIISNSQEDNMPTVETFYYTDTNVFGSQAIDQAWFDSDTDSLVIKFNAGKIYGFSNVDFSTWNDFCGASSAGRYFSANIRGNGRVIDDVEMVARPQGFNDESDSTYDDDSLDVTLNVTADGALTVPVPTGAKSLTVTLCWEF